MSKRKHEHPMRPLAFGASSEDDGLPPMDTDDNAAPLGRKEYRSELGGLQVQLFRLQSWVVGEGRRLVIVLEGLGPAGKGGTARRIAEGFDKRVCRVVTLDLPRKRERAQWPFQRYVEHFPPAGHVVVFDGSWYHGPAIERALGASSEAEFDEFLHSVAEFERVLVDSGITLAKFWFAASDREQDERFRAHIAEIGKQKGAHLPEVAAGRSPVNVAEVADHVLRITDGPAAPWRIIEATEKRRARLECLAQLLTLPTKEPAAG